MEKFCEKLVRYRVPLLILACVVAVAFAVPGALFIFWCEEKAETPSRGTMTPGWRQGGNWRAVPQSGFRFTR